MDLTITSEVVEVSLEVTVESGDFVIEISETAPVPDIVLNVQEEVAFAVPASIETRITDLENKVITFLEETITEDEPVIKNAPKPVLQVILIDNDDGGKRYYPEFTTQNDDLTATFYVGWDITDATIKLILE